MENKMTENTITIAQMDDDELMPQLAEMEKENIVEFFKNNPKVKLDINYYSHDDSVNKFLSKIEQLQKEEYLPILKQFQLNFNISCMMGDTWNPHILMNGGVLIRNIHRVVSIDAVHDEVIISKEKVKQDLIEILSDNQNIDNDVPNIFLIHNNSCKIQYLVENDAIEKCELSDFGQTLIFINASDFIASSVSKTNIFKSSSFKKASQSTRGFVVLRVFSKQSFIHTCFRASDDYDTILENYSFNPTYDDIDSGVKNDYDLIFSEVKDMFQENTFSDIPIKSENFKKDFLVHLENTYLKKLVWQIMEFSPFFKLAADEPTSYYDDNLPYDKNLINDNCIQLKSSSLKFEALIKFAEEEVQTVLDSFIDHVKFSLVDVNSQEWEAKSQNTVIKNSYELTNHLNLELIKYKEENNIKKMKRSDWNEFSEWLCLEFTFTFKMENPKLVKTLHKTFLNISKHKIFQNSVSGIIPPLGFLQGYYKGEVDTGNYNSFLNM